MKLHVRNYRGIQRADLDLSGVAVVAGPNGSGKTSLAEGLKACLTGQPIVVHPEVEKVPMKNAAELLNDGSDNGYVILARGEADKFEINYPSCKSKSVGQPAHASEIVCGSIDESLPKLRPQFRATALRQLIEADPTIDDFTKYLREQGLDLSAKHAQQIWALIEEKEWQGAHDQAKGKGLENKGAFVEATGGTSWTKETAGDWRPDGYKPEWDGNEEAMFETVIKVAQENYDEVVGKGFVEASERAALEETAADLNARIDGLEKLVDRRSVIEVDLIDVQRRHQETMPAHLFSRRPCPHCGAEIAVVRPVAGGSELDLMKGAEFVDERNPADLKERRLAIAAIEGEVSNVQSDLSVTKGKIMHSEQGVSEAQVARDRLQGLGKPATEDQVKARDKAQMVVAQAHKNLAVFKSLQRAQKLDGAIRRNIILVEALAPMGVRQTVMGTKLEPFNARISDVSASMGIPQVSVDEDMLIWMGKRPYRNCSESEKFRIRVALQIAWALEDGSDALVIDNDVDMDPSYYMSLISTLCHFDMKALISIRIDRKDRVPDFTIAPDDIAGVVYWLEDGEAKEVSRKAAAENGGDE